MTDLPIRRANRLRKPSWRDSRLLAGVLLVLASTALGSVVVARADDRVPMYAAKGALVPGDRLSADNVVRVDVQLGSGGARYLSAATALPSDAFAVREVRPGELIAVSAIGGRSEVAVQPVTLMADATSALALVRGSVVDVYVDEPKPGTTQEMAGAEQVLTSVSVAGAPETAGGFGATSDQVAVRVVVPKDSVRTIIDHIDKGSRITLVPVPGSPVKGAS